MKMTKRILACFLVCTLMFFGGCGRSNPAGTGTSDTDTFEGSVGDNGVIGDILDEIATAASDIGSDIGEGVSDIGSEWEEDFSENTPPEAR